MQAVTAIAGPAAIARSDRSSAIEPAAGPGVALKIEGRIARLGLCESRRGNLLTLPTVNALRELLAAARADRTVALAVIEGEAGVFCSGADLAGFCRARVDGTDAARDFARAASALVRDIVRLGKPVLSVMDGLVVGGGLALGAHATYRVVTNRTRVALPQTAVGLVPDLGLSRLLARAPQGIGPYLCLSAAAIDAADAIFAGFADGYVHSDRIEHLMERLANPYAGDIETILNGFAGDPGSASLAAAEGDIGALFAQPSVDVILTSLAGKERSLLRDAASAISSGSPVAMQLALALIKQSGDLRRLEDCLRAEHHFVCKLLDCGEAYEGISARLLNAGRLPRWLAPRPTDVDAAVLAPFLTPLLPGDGLQLEPVLHS